MPQEKDLKKTTEQKKDSNGTDRTKLAVNAALAAPVVVRTGRSIAQGIKFKGQVANATMPNPKYNGAATPTEPRRIPIPNPKVDPKTGRGLPLTSPVRATQTQAQVKPVGQDLFRQAARDAILREAKSAKNPIGAAFTNARISMGGTGTPVVPQIGTSRRTASPELQQELKDAKGRINNAKNLKDVRSVIEDMGSLGKNSILGMPISPGVGKVVRGVTGSPAFKAVSRYAPFLGPALSTAEYFLSSKEAQNFADAKAKQNPNATGNKNKPPAPTNKPKTYDGSPEENKLIDVFNQFKFEVDNDPYIGEDQGRNEQAKRMIAWVNKHPELIPAFNASKRIQAELNRR
jgi:hypothetical protein